MNEAHVCWNCGSPLPAGAPGTVERCKFCGAESRETPAVQPFDPAKLNASPKPTLAIIAGLVGALVIALVVILTMSRGAASRGSAAGAHAPRARFDVTLDGERFTLVPASDGYQVDRDGHARERVKVEGDRVKVEDSAGKQLAEVKKKDYGFKVYDPSGGVVVEGKHAGAGWKLKRPSGEEVAKLSGSSDDAIAAVAALTAEERLAIVVFIHEGEP